MRFYCRWVGLSDSQYKKRTGCRYLPPATLRYRVHGSPLIDSYLYIGKKSSEDILSALAKIGKNMRSFEKILDFGCGSGRTLINFFELYPEIKFFGTDIDPEAISWCQKNLRFAQFSTNKHLPELAYPPATFDFVYAVSVFTHLDEDFQYKWLEELKRVTKPGGIMLLTFHGEHCWQNLEKEEIEELKNKGFLFRKPFLLKGILPDWYQTAFHSEKYIRENYVKYFELLDYLPRGLNKHHDIAIFKRT
ncbi:MAG: class I SAM-dependent methyltransferase [Candidatus Moraniibacteriota bacterium]